MTYDHTLYDHKVSNHFLNNFLTILFFTEIASVIIFVKYNNDWVENKINIDNESMGILVSISMSYGDSLEILFEAFDFNLGILTLDHRCFDQDNINFFRVRGSLECAS